MRWKPLVKKRKTRQTGKADAEEGRWCKTTVNGKFQCPRRDPRGKIVQHSSYSLQCRHPTLLLTKKNRYGYAEVLQTGKRKKNLRGQTLTRPKMPISADPFIFLIAALATVLPRASPTNPSDGRIQVAKGFISPMSSSRRLWQPYIMKLHCPRTVKSKYNNLLSGLLFLWERTWNSFKSRRGIIHGDQECTLQ